LTATVSELELAREIEQLRAEPAWQEFDRNAKTLVKNPELRIVLMTLKPGARLDEHVAAGAISIQVLSGRVRVHLPSESVELPAGELVAVAPAIRHDLEALESSAVLLTIAQPGTESRPEPDVTRPVTVTEPVVEPVRACVAPVHLSPDEQANMTEGDLRPDFDTQVRGNCFAPIEGYTVVKSGPTSFRHHGFYVVDEPCKNMKPAPQREDYIKHVEARLGARIPGEVMPGEAPVDTASGSLIQPTPAQLGITNCVDASYPDLRHLTRGGPQMASR
jgi:quercetin dioxygenase-like cupin family protein